MVAQLVEQEPPPSPQTCLRKLMEHGYLICFKLQVQVLPMRLKSLVSLFHCESYDKAHYTRFYNLVCGMEKWQLAWLITKRTTVRIRLPLFKVGVSCLIDKRPAGAAPPVRCRANHGRRATGRSSRESSN